MQMTRGQRITQKRMKKHNQDIIDMMKDSQVTAKDLAVHYGLERVQIEARLARRELTDQEKEIFARRIRAVATYKNET